MSRLRELIIKYSTPEPNTGCWLWERSLSNGYGQFGPRGERRAHRVAFEAFNGPIPAGLVVCHRCDVKSCVNPEHLFLGTHADNVRDMVQKGRQFSGPRPPTEKIPRGEQRPNAKLTADAVRDIRKRWARGQSLRSLAREHGVTDITLRNAAVGLTWRHV